MEDIKINHRSMIRNSKIISNQKQIMTFSIDQRLLH